MESKGRKNLSWKQIVFIIIIWTIIYWLVTLCRGSAIDKVVVHRCKYRVTFFASDGTYQDSETITITVNRPVTLKRIHDFWLRKNDGADINEDGIVNFKDYAILTGGN